VSLDENEVGHPRILTSPMRVLLLVAGALVFLAGIQLFVFPLRTDRWFAWTIAPPMTAVFLGASYWSALVFEVMAARERRWADARISVPTVFVFTTLTLVATLIHLDKFHFGPRFANTTRAVTWAWLAIYALVPIIMVVLWVLQARRPGGDPPRARPLPKVVRATIAIQAMLLLGMGVALFVAPLRAAAWWPWTLTPLTGRAVGAWCIGLGVAAAQSVWEDDVRRLRPAAAAFLAFGVLQAIALARHGDDIDWGRASAWIYLAYVVSAAVIGAIVLIEGRALDDLVARDRPQVRAANVAKSTDPSTRVDS
jgi:hypothetical protein